MMRLLMHLIIKLLVFFVCMRRLLLPKPPNSIWTVTAPILARLSSHLPKPSAKLVISTKMLMTPINLKTLCHVAMKRVSSNNGKKK